MKDIAEGLRECGPVDVVAIQASASADVVTASAGPTEAPGSNAGSREDEHETAWTIVFRECLARGMKCQTGQSGIEDVIAFIRALSVAAESRTAEPSVHACPVCPSEVKLAERYAELRHAVEWIKPLIDAHFAAARTPALDRASNDADALAVTTAAAAPEGRLPAEGRETEP